MILELRKHILATAHHPDEIEGDESAGDAQEHTSRYTLHGPLTVEMEREKCCVATEDIGETSGRHTRDENRQQCRHRHVDHQHLKRKYQSGYRSLEDTRNGTSRTTAHKCHQHLTVHAEHLAEVRANGGARQNDRSLGSHRTTEADGDGRGDNRRPAVMRF